ncbi:hypothetical protein Tco_1220737, partial [Tanacetum coccineum]
YLKGKPKLGLWYPRVSPFDLETYLDSDYAGASLDRKSTRGGCQFLSRRLISWQCKKQTILATSTTKAEYVAAAITVGKFCGFKIKLVSTTFVEQFIGLSAKSKIINNVRYITAKVAGKPVSISGASIRSDLFFDDVDGIDSLPNKGYYLNA